MHFDLTPRARAAAENGRSSPPARPGIPLAAVILATLLATSGCSTKDGTFRTGGDVTGSRLVAFASDRNQVQGQFDVYLYDLERLDLRPLNGINSTVPDLRPTLRPDGLYVAFQADRGGPTGLDIYFYSRAGERLVDQPGINTADQESDPAFTADSRRIAFVRGTTTRRIHLLDGVPDTLVALPGIDATGTFSDWAPSPNQDGSMIAFVSDRSGNPDVYVWSRALGVMDLPDLRSGGDDLDPSLTPDGRFVCFASNRAGGAGGYDLYLYEFEFHRFLTLTVNTPADEKNPSLSPDTNVILFESNRTGGPGKSDLWTHRRSDGATGQPASLSSAGDDLQPSLIWR